MKDDDISYLSILYYYNLSEQTSRYYQCNTSSQLIFIILIHFVPFSFNFFLQSYLFIYSKIIDI